MGRTDTIQSIALRFNVSAAWLRQVNGLLNDIIFPGDELIVTRPRETELVQPHDAVLIDITNFQELAAGRVVMIGDTFRFECPPMRPIIGELATAIDASLVPHPVSPEQERAILTLSFRDQDSDVELLYAFAGERTGLGRFHHAVCERIRNRRSSEVLVRAHPLAPEPRPDAIGMSQSARSLGSREAETPLSLDLGLVAPAERAALSPRPATVAAVRLLPSIHWIGGHSDIIDEEEATKIRGLLSVRARSADWRRLFSLAQDGTARLTFRDHVGDRKPVVALVKTVAGERLAAFVGGGLGIARTPAGADVIVYRVRPEFGAYRKQLGAAAYAFCSLTELVIGGSDAAALWIDDSFLHGVSEPCSAFAAPALTAERNWRVANLEVYWLDPSTFNA